MSLLLGQAITDIRHDYPKEDGVKGDPLGIGVATIITLQVLTFPNSIIGFPLQLYNFLLGRINIVFTWVLQTRLHRCCAKSSTSEGIRFRRRYRHHDVSPRPPSASPVNSTSCTVNN